MVFSFATAEACRRASLQNPPLLIAIAADFGNARPLVRAARQLLPPATVLLFDPPGGRAGSSAYALLSAGANALIPSDEVSHAQLARSARHLAADRPADPTATPANLLGTSAPMQLVFQLIRKAAASSITVSVRGETGTGKEEVARAIHLASARADGPFLGLNMAAIPRELLESELFGHEKGAFTGATATRVGHFELAGGGTLFLDEIADLDLALQAKLLRVVQERVFTRVGGQQPRPLAARLIVATHADLAHCVRTGTFREDLYYRLLGLPITLPPLRERGCDILQLANRFLREFSPATSGPPHRFSPAAEQRLMAHAYPGNVRELRAVVELAAVLADGPLVEPEDLMFPPHCYGEPLPDLPDAARPRTLRQHVVEIVQGYLNHYHGNVLAVAGHLGVGKSTLYRMIQSGEVRATP